MHARKGCLRSSSPELPGKLPALYGDGRSLFCTNQWLPKRDGRRAAYRVLCREAAAATAAAYTLDDWHCPRKAIDYVREEPRHHLSSFPPTLCQPGTVLLTPVLKSLFFQLYAKRGALKLGILCSCEPFLAFVLNSIKRAFTLWPSYPRLRSFLSEYKREGDGYLIDVTRLQSPKRAFQAVLGMVYIACEPSTFTPPRLRWL